MKYQRIDQVQEQETKKSKLDKMCSSIVEDYAKKGRVLFDKNGNVHTGESLSLESQEVFSSEKYKKWKEAHR
ncbi:MAG: hypothetical protein ACXVLQ_18085 [Bacteriovorax sp.]